LIPNQYGAVKRSVMNSLYVEYLQRACVN